MSFDIKATTGWLEPLTQKIKDNPKTIVIPSIDGIDDRTIAFHGSPVSCHLFYNPGKCRIIITSWLSCLKLYSRSQIYW